MFVTARLTARTWRIRDREHARHARDPAREPAAVVAGPRPHTGDHREPVERRRRAVADVLGQVGPEVSAARSVQPSGSRAPRSARCVPSSDRSRRRPRPADRRQRRTDTTASRRSICAETAPGSAAISGSAGHDRPHATDNGEQAGGPLVRDHGHDRDRRAAGGRGDRLRALAARATRTVTGRVALGQGRRPRPRAPRPGPPGAVLVRRLALRPTRCLPRPRRRSAGRPPAASIG